MWETIPTSPDPLDQNRGVNESLSCPFLPPLTKKQFATSKLGKKQVKSPTWDGFSYFTGFEF